MHNLSGQTIRGYELLELVGAGGFGAVYRADQPIVGREVAIKVILPQYANHPDFIRRFEIEAQLVARLEHPHIVPLYDYWREPDGAYLVMRWLRGSLRRSLEAGPWSLLAVSRLVDEVASALAVAHRHGVIHRDIKPDNILLDNEGNTYLADFGIAKDLSSASATEQGAIVGSPLYITPEQIRSENVTPQTDIYSLGLVLYELLIGTKAFGDLTPPSLIYKHLNEPLPSLRETRPEIPEILNAVIQKATAKKPEDRYPDTLSLALAFRKAVGRRATGEIGAALDSSSGEKGVTPPGIKTLEDTPTLLGELLTVAEPENPYKGLQAFQEADATDFFGREGLTEHLLARLGEATEFHRFLAVVGPSGSGKSSVVRAGLIPALRGGRLPGSANWFLVEMLPGTHPLEEVELALLRIAVHQPPSLLTQLREDPRGLLRAVRRILPEDGSELMLVIDQFEEVFTLMEDPAESAFFLESLYAAVTAAHTPLRVIITLRADFYDRPLMHPNFSALVSERTQVVVPLTPDELERAISLPAAGVGLALEPGLVAAIVAEVHEQPGALPLLQYALTELFDRRQDNMLTLAGYNAIGGTLGALARRADQVCSELDAQGQEMARQLFLRLVTLGEGTEDTRRRTLQSELLSIGSHPAAMQSVIAAFDQSRLLSFDRDPATRGPTVEVAHEAILREWGRLRTWLDESRADVRLQRLLAVSAAEWLKANRDSSFLLSGSRLAQFEGWARETSLALTQEERTYLEASLAEGERVAAAEQERQLREKELERRSITFLRALVAVLLLAVLGAFGLTGVAVHQSNVAYTSATLATARELAAAAVTNLSADPQLSLLLALRSVRSTYDIDGTLTRESEEALHRAVGTAQARRIFVGHTGSISDLAYSPDGTRLATASLDGTIRVWDAATGETTLTLDERAAVQDIVGDTTNHELYSLAYSPDGTRIVTGSRDGATVIWDAVTGEAALRFYDSDSAFRVYRVAYSPDGTRVAALSTSLPQGAFVPLFSGALEQDHWRVKVWDLASREEVFAFASSTGGGVVGGGVIWGGLAFSPDGRLLAVAGSTDVQIWDLVEQQQVLTLTGHTQTILDLAFSSDGTRLTTASADTTIKIWDIATPLGLGLPTTREALTLSGTGSSRATYGITSFAFRPDGRWLVTGSLDAVAQIWDAASGSPIYSLSGYAGSVTTFALSPDSQTLATVSSDAVARLWDMSPGKELFSLQLDGPTGSNLVFNPEGARLAFAGGSNPSVIVDAITGQLLLALPNHGQVTQTIVYSPDGTRVAMNGDPPSVRDAATGEELLSLTGHDGFTEIVAYSPDGRLIASGGSDETVRVWDATTGALLHTLTGHHGSIHCLDFSSDNVHLVSGGDDRQVIVWDATTGQEVFSVPTNANVVFQVSYSPDGMRFGIADASETATIWDAETGALVWELGGHPVSVGAVEFSPDGNLIVTTGGAIAKLWDAHSGRELLTLYSHANSSIGYAIFSPDNQHLALQEGQGISVYTLAITELIAIAESRVTRSWTPEECLRYLHVDTCPAGI